MTRTNQANLCKSGSQSCSDSDTLSSETDVDSAGSLLDFVVDGDESVGGDYLPNSETASIALMQSGLRLQISDTLDLVILELIRLRDLLHEGDAVETAESGTST
ncbi:hypothetical protein BB8028_0012g00010 [Beauveria bassiana]|uniref:Uncharacterized protein n=1 Tax=Beauveria bassiana TaxID=176275 RepID=A0A2S7YQ62_BEABA|nr:hypothetical protein BB8028_0012g00010 [Beauveria bassiana]